ncbi:dihydrouridine synthase (dus) protein [Toxoplasma gondii VEG]|uniref:tRNA-dihydrouridine(47) synthase [NAD(P)(+)] n=9 Tax=Toxoplasma gondii TaxID=5811 RepID=B9Q8D5_TOXGV|nr:dihydrouridine synthase (dus) protein [Toxoplasma gondii VEG]CEL76365.1 TPA: tRNA-dihydrouridine synthase 3-like [Toxoplasma gondii VEG]
MASRVGPESPSAGRQKQPADVKSGDALKSPSPSSTVSAWSRASSSLSTGAVSPPSCSPSSLLAGSPLTCRSSIGLPGERPSSSVSEAPAVAHAETQQRATAGYVFVVGKRRRESADASDMHSAALPLPPNLPPFVSFNCDHLLSALNPELLGAHAAICLQRGEAPMVPDWIRASGFSSEGSDEEESDGDTDRCVKEGNARPASASLPSSLPTSSSSKSSASASTPPPPQGHEGPCGGQWVKKQERETRRWSTRRLLKEAERLGALTTNNGGQLTLSEESSAERESARQVGHCSCRVEGEANEGGSLQERRDALLLQLQRRFDDRLRRLQRGGEGGGLGLGAVRKLLEWHAESDGKTCSREAGLGAALASSPSGLHEDGGELKQRENSSRDAGAEEREREETKNGAEERSQKDDGRQRNSGEAGDGRPAPHNSGTKGKKASFNPLVEWCGNEESAHLEENDLEGGTMRGGKEERTAVDAPEFSSAQEGRQRVSEDASCAREKRRSCRADGDDEERSKTQDGDETRKRRRGQNSAVERLANTQQIRKEAAAQDFCLRMAACGSCEGAEGKAADGLDKARPGGSNHEGENENHSREGETNVEAKQRRMHAQKVVPVCRRPHDLKAFLKTRPEDIQTRSCPFFDAGFPLCPFGACCRFGACHIDAEGFNLCADGSRVTPDALEALQRRLHAEEELNCVSSFRAKTIAQDSKQKVGSNCGPGHLDTSSEHPRFSNDTAVASCLPSSPSSTPPCATSALSSSLDAEGCSCSSSASSFSSSAFPVDGETERLRVGSLSALSPREQRVATRETFRRRLLDSPRGRGRRLILAPLTTVGNLPFRRLCVELGAEVTVSEMAVAKSIVDGKQSELSLLKRHKSETFFGVQIAGGTPEVLNACTDILASEDVSCDFIDLNAACPLVQLHRRFKAGACMLDHPKRLESLVESMTTRHPEVPVTVKLRTANQGKKQVLHSFIRRLGDAGAAALIVHGRTAQQRYTKAADWSYVAQCREALDSSTPLIGCGDIFSSPEFEFRLASGASDGLMIARAALVKPWVFTEISERKVWDISASERLDLLKRFVRFGLEHWGSDSRGVATTRRFLLELLSFQHRYVPPPFFEFLPQLLQWRPSPFVARSNLENMLASPSVKDWIDISSLLLGPPPEDFSFVPKHASNSYAPLSSSTSSLSTVRASADPSGLQPPSGGLLFDVTSFFHSQILGNGVVREFGA